MIKLVCDKCGAEELITQATRQYDLCDKCTKEYETRKEVIESRAEKSLARLENEYYPKEEVAAEPQPEMYRWVEMSSGGLKLEFSPEYLEWKKNQRRSAA